MDYIARKVEYYMLFHNKDKIVFDKLIENQHLGYDAEFFTLSIYNTADELNAILAEYGLHYDELGGG